MLRGGAPVRRVPAFSMTLRKIIFWLHLSVALLVGGFIFVMAITGIAMAYKNHLIDWAESRYQCTPPSDRAARLPAVALLQSGRAGSSAIPLRMTLHHDPTAATEFLFRNDRVLFVNPYTGSLLGEGATGLRHFFHMIENIHRFLGFGGTSYQETAKAFTGACSLALVLLILTGIILWWPYKWKWQKVQTAMLFQRGLTRHTRDRNWHNVIGFWGAIPLFVIALTGFLMAYPWSTDLLDQLFSGKPAPARQQQTRTDLSEGSLKDLDGDRFERLWQIAQNQEPSWQTIELQIPSSEKGPVTFTIDQGNRIRPDLWTRITVERNTGAVLLSDRYSNQSVVRQLRAWVKPVHTGEIGSYFGETLCAVVAAGVLLLVWTGFALAWKRFFGRKSEQLSSPEISSKPMKSPR